MIGCQIPGSVTQVESPVNNEKFESRCQINCNYIDFLDHLITEKSGDFGLQWGLTVSRKNVITRVLRSHIHLKMVPINKRVVNYHKFI